MNHRTLLFHGITYPSVAQSFHPRTQVSGYQPYLANGTPGCLSLWFWARLFDLQGFAKEEEDVRLYIVWSKQAGRSTPRFTVLIEFT